MIEPQEVEIKSGTSDRIYEVTTPTLWNPHGICDPECKGYMYRGYCRHIKEAVNEAVCFYGTKDQTEKTCRSCGRELIDVIIND